MVQQDKLFVLIKSLTSGEKTYFSKYSRIHHAKEKPDYLRLFEFIDAQEEYDENGVKKHFKKDKFIKQLSRKKTQLKEKILESLSIFHADRTVEASLRRQMVLLPVLYEKASRRKNLIKDYDKLIKDIKKTAEEHEYFSILIELFEWERRLIVLQDDKSKIESKILKLVESRGEYLQRNSIETALANMYEEVYSLIVKDINLFKTENRTRFDDVLNGLSSFEDIKMMSKKSLRYYYFIKSNYHRVNGDLKKGYAYAKQVAEVYESGNIIDNETALNYKNALCYILAVGRDAQMLEDFPVIIDKMRACYGGNEDIRTFNSTRFQALNCWLNILNITAAIDVADEIELRWDELCEIIPKRRQLAFCYNIVVAYWFGGMLDKAIYWLSLMFNHEKSREGERFVYDARLIQFPIYYDMDDINLSNRIDSTRRILADQKRLSEFEQIVITYFRKLVRCIDTKEAIITIKSFLAELETYKKNNSSVILPTCLIPLELWCKSKERNGLKMNRLPILV